MPPRLRHFVYFRDFEMYSSSRGPTCDSMASCYYLQFTRAMLVSQIQRAYLCITDRYADGAFRAWMIKRELPDLAADQLLSAGLSASHCGHMTPQICHRHDHHPPAASAVIFLCVGLVLIHLSQHWPPCTPAASSLNRQCVIGIEKLNSVWTQTSLFSQSPDAEVENVYIRQWLFFHGLFSSLKANTLFTCNALTSASGGQISWDGRSVRHVDGHLTEGWHSSVVSRLSEDMSP